MCIHEKVRIVRNVLGHSQPFTCEACCFCLLTSDYIIRVFLCQRVSTKDSLCGKIYRCLQSTHVNSYTKCSQVSLLKYGDFYWFTGILEGNILRTMYRDRQKGLTVFQLVEPSLFKLHFLKTSFQFCI